MEIHKDQIRFFFPYNLQCFNTAACLKQVEKTSMKKSLFLLQKKMYIIHKQNLFSHHWSLPIFQPDNQKLHTALTLPDDIYESGSRSQKIRINFGCKTVLEADY